MILRSLQWLICILALASVPAVMLLTAPREQAYPALSASARELNRGLDCLDVDPNVPMDPDNALVHFEWALKDPAASSRDKQLALFLKAWSLFTRPGPDFAGARAALIELTKAKPDPHLLAQAFFLLGMIETVRPADPNYTEAVQWYKQVTQTAPDSTLAAHARVQMATLCRSELKQPLEAARWYSEAFDLGGQAFQLDERTSFRYMQAKMLQLAGRNQQAVDAYRSILQTGGGNALRWSDRVLNRLEELGADPGDWDAQTSTTPDTETQHRFTPSKPITLSVSFWILAKKGMCEAIQEICRRYHERNPMVTINLVDLPFGGYHDWLQTQILGRDIPDIVQIDNATAIRYGSDQGRLIDITDYMSSPNVYTGRTWADMYYPQMILQARDPVRRRQWTVSWASENCGFFYNKDAFRRAGVIKRKPDGSPELDDSGKPAVAEPQTWDELIEAFRKLKKVGIYGEVCEFYPDPAPLIWQEPYITKQIYHSLIPKLDVLAADDFPDPFEITKCILDGSLDLRDPRVSEIWRLFYAKSEFWVPGCTSTDIRQVYSDFASSRTATLFWVSSELPDFERMCDFEIGVFPFPSLRGNRFYDGEYSETPSMRAFEFSVPKVTAERGTRDAAIDFMMFFTSPESQKLLVDKGGTLSPLRALPPSKRIEPFMRRMNRRGTHLHTFLPYSIGIIKEPYWAEGNTKLMNELNRLLGDIPNYEYYKRIIGGSEEQYQTWREKRFAVFLEELQKYFKKAYGRVVRDYSEDMHQDLQRNYKKWIHDYRACVLNQASAVKTDCSTETLEQNWRAILDHWGVVTICEKMMPQQARLARYQPPPLTYAAQKQIYRAMLIAVAVLFAALVLMFAWKGSLGRFLRDWTYVKWLVITVSLLLLFSYFPASSAIFHAFFRWNGSDISEFIGLRNFQQILSDDVLYQSFGIMLVFLAANFVKLLPTIFVAIIMFHLASRRVQYWFRVFFVLPLIIPGIVGLLMWKYFYQMEGGLLNALFLNLGLIRAPVNWLGNESTVLWSMLFIGFPFVSTIGVLILLAGLQSIPESVFEAAKVDGCGVTRRFTAIEMPLLMNQIKLNVVLVTIGTIQDFGLPLILTRGGPNNASMLPGLWMYLNAFSYGKMGYAAAIGVVMFLIILNLTYINMRYMRAHKD